MYISNCVHFVHIFIYFIGEYLSFVVFVNTHGLCEMALDVCVIPILVLILVVVSKLFLICVDLGWNLFNNFILII